MIAFSAPIKAAEPEKPAPSQPEEPKANKVERFRVVSPDDEARFKAHVARGDRALDAGRLNDAVIAYLDALDIKFDARLSGRLGLVPGQEPKAVVVREPPERVIIRDEIPVEELRTPEPVAKKEESPRPRFAGGIGPIMVFGAAPSPSLGFSVTGQYRMDGVTAMAIAKGAWSLGDQKDPPIHIFSAAAIVGPCVQWQWLDACAFGGATFFERRVSPNPSYRVDPVREVIPSLGLGIGSTFKLRESVAARVFVDATALTRDMVIGVITPDNPKTPLWQTQRFLLSVSASLMFGR